MASASAPVPISEIPPYLRNASPVPADKRAPWYMNTAPTYAGIFLWFAFYNELGVALREGTFLAALIGIVAAGAVCHLMFYYVPGMLGMKTGLPLYIVGTSTFGTKGGYFIPGIFMGLLQIGWYSVATFFATKLILNGFGFAAVTPYGPMDGKLEAQFITTGGQAGFDVTFVVLAIIWGYLFAFIGALGINYVAKMSQFFPVVPIVMLLIGAVQALPYLGDFQVKHTPPDITWVSVGTLLMIQLVVGFFGTAGAVGADFCSNNRGEQDVKLGGLTGIWLAIIYTAGLALLTVAGAHGKDPSLTSWSYQAALETLGGFLAAVMLILFAIGSMAPACFCSFIIGNSLSTMLGSPRTRIPITLAGATVGIVIAVTGASANLVPYFGLIGASFGPVIGAMIADYFLNGAEWAGPREGINYPGYIAWAVGFLVGISNNQVVNEQLLGIKDPALWILADWHPTGVYSLIVGMIVYVVMARLMGLPARLEGVVRTESGKG